VFLFVQFDLNWDGFSRIPVGCSSYVLSSFIILFYFSYNYSRSRGPFLNELKVYEGLGYIFCKCLISCKVTDLYLLHCNPIPRIEFHNTDYQLISERGTSIFVGGA
jgi:hypothetical protein